MGRSWLHRNCSPLIYNLSYILPIIVHPTTRSEGFEPPGLLHPSVFKTDALGHSANFSSSIIIPDSCQKSTTFYTILFGLGGVTRGGGVGTPVGLSGVGVTGSTTGASLYADATRDSASSLTPSSVKASSFLSYVKNTLTG